MKNLVDYMLNAISICGVIVLLSINTIFVVASCPNYGVESSACPDAPDPYNNGNCAGNAQVCPTRGELAVNSGNFTLVSKTNSQIVSNSTPVCYTIRTCSIVTETDQSGNSYQVCKPSFEVFTGYAYVAGSCPG
jgi:hypothetical protein